MITDAPGNLFAEWHGFEQGVGQTIAFCGLSSLAKARKPTGSKKRRLGHGRPPAGWQAGVVSRKWMDKGWTKDGQTTEFSEQGPLVHFLEKSGAQGVGDLKDGTQHALGQRIQLIGVPRRSSAAKLKCRPDVKALESNSSAADKRRSTPIFGRNRGTRPVQLIPGRCTSLPTPACPLTARRGLRDRVRPSVAASWSSFRRGPLRPPASYPPPAFRD